VENPILGHFFAGRSSETWYSCVHYSTPARGKQLKTLKIVLPVALIALCFSAKAFADPSVPEINPADGISALALLGGAVMVFRGRFKK
jgi:hypothetical protein